MGRPNKASMINDPDRRATAGAGALAQHATFADAARAHRVAVGRGTVQSGSGAALRGQRSGLAIGAGGTKSAGRQGCIRIAAGPTPHSR